MSKLEMVRLGDICLDMHQGINTVADKIEYQEKGIPIIQSKNITKGYLDLDDVRYLDANDYKKYNSKYNPRIGDLLICNIGTIGKSYTIVKEEKFLIAWNLFIVKLKVNLVLPQYVQHYLNFLNSISYFDKLLTGGTVKFINKTKMSNIEIPLPSLEVQKYIADIFDKTQEIIDGHKKQHEELDNLIKATFIEMFGDLIINDKNWQMKYLSDFYLDKNAVKCGPFGSALKKDEYVNNGIPVWVMDNISKEGDFIDNPYLYVTNAKFQDLKSYNVQNRDIIISRAGTVGKMCVVNASYDKSIISTNLIRLRLNNDILPMWVIRLIRYTGNNFCRLKTGNEDAFTHMNTGVLNNIYFPYPPLELQNKFAKIVTNIEEQKSLVKQSITQSETLFNSLMSKYFDE